MKIDEHGYGSTHHDSQLKHMNTVDIFETNCIAETVWSKNLENPDGFGIPSQFGILQAFQCRLL